MAKKKENDVIMINTIQQARGAGKPQRQAKEKVAKTKEKRGKKK